MLPSEIEERETHEIDHRLEAMGWMVTKIVHDIRNPLGSIELISSLLRKELNDDMDKQKLIDHVIYGVKNIDNVLSNLLHFTHHPAPKLKMVKIKEVLAQCLGVMSYAIEKHQITVIQDIAPDIQIFCDSALMKQVFVNLFLNSLQAMTHGGHLSIKVLRNEKAPDIEIYIKDNGSGITPENLNRIFDPFFTTREKGTGLGLTIVHNIIRAHRGSIRAYSKPGEWALFIVKIPEYKGQ